jgi:hypothetical protein
MQTPICASFKVRAKTGSSTETTLKRTTQMTNFKTTTLIAALAIAAPAVAMAQAMADIDVNGDGVLTIDEMQAVFDDVSTDGFSAMDLNADGVLDVEEVQAAQEASLMPEG